MNKTANTIPTRNEVPVEYTWNLSDLYPTDDAWKADLSKIKDILPSIEAFQGTLGTSSDKLLGFLKLQDEISVLLDSFANYAMRKADEDTKNTTYQGYKDQTMSLYVSITSTLSFAEPEILNIEDSVLEGFYIEKPELNTYKRYINDIRKKKGPYT